MPTVCLTCEKRHSSSVQSRGSLVAKINILNNALTKANAKAAVSLQDGVLVSSKARIISPSSFKSSNLLSANLKVNNKSLANIRTTPSYSLNLRARAKDGFVFPNVLVDKFAGSVERIKNLVDYVCTQKLYPISDIVTGLNNSYFVDKNLNFNNLYNSIDEGVHLGNYVKTGKQSVLISDEKGSYIQPSSVFTKGDFRYKFEVTKPNTIEDSFLFIRASAPISNYDSNIPPQYRLHNIKLEDPSGNLIIKYKDITVRGDADYLTDYVNFVTYISEPEINNLKLNVWDDNYPLMNENSGYSLNIDFAIDCLDDPFSEGFNKGYEDTCKLDFVNSSNNDYLSLDGSPLSTHTQNFSLNPTNSLRISAIEICNSGGVGILNGDYLKFYTDVSPTGQRLQRKILPSEILSYNVNLDIYPPVESVWESSSDDFGNFGTNTSPSGNGLLLSKLQDDSVFNYIKLINNDPQTDSGRLTLKFSHKAPNFVDALTNGSFNLSYNNEFNRAILQSIRGQDNFFIVDNVALKVVAKKEVGARDYVLDILGYSDDKLLNVTPKVDAFLQNLEEGFGDIPQVSGFVGVDDLGIATESISDKSQYFDANLINNPAGDHYKLSTQPIISGITFSEYIIPLNIYVDQSKLGQPKTYNNSSLFENLYIDLYNIPSGAIISTVQLMVDYKPSHGIMLHTFGSEAQREYATRNIVLYPDSDAENSNKRPLSVIENIPQAFTNDDTIKFNYSRRWRANNHDILDGAFNPNEFDLFSFYNPALESPFLGGHFKFNSDELPYILSENLGQNIPYSGLMVGNYEKIENIGLRFKNETIDWASSIPNHELSGQILDAYNNAVVINAENYIDFGDIDFSSGLGLYIRFTPTSSVSGVDYNLFNSGVLFSKWDNGNNLEFSLGYSDGHLCGYARTSDGDIIQVTDDLTYDSYQYPLSVVLTYNDNLSNKLRLYTDNEIAENFTTLRNSSSEFSISAGSSSLVLGNCSGSGVGFDMFVHEFGISTFNSRGNNLVFNNNDRLYRQTSVDKFLESHRATFVDHSRSKFYDYVKDDVDSWKLGDFKVCSFSADFDRLTKRSGDKFISHQLYHSGSGYENITTQPLPSSINFGEVSYHTQIENDSLRFNLSDVPESDNFYSTYPRISKNIPRGYDFSKQSIVVETILEHVTNNDLVWSNQKVGPKFIVSLYTTNKEDSNRSSQNNLGLVSRAAHYLEPSGCFFKLNSALKYQDIYDEEPWSAFNNEILINDFNHQYFSKDINDMFLQYDIAYPESSGFHSYIRIHNANIKLGNAIRKAAYSNSTINLANSGELKSLLELPLYVFGKDSLSSGVSLYVGAVSPPSTFDDIGLFNFGVLDILPKSLPLYCHNINENTVILPLYISAKTDKFAENSFNIFTQNLFIDQSWDQALFLTLKNKALELDSNSIELFVEGFPILPNRIPSNNLGLFIDAFNDITFGGFNVMPLYVGASGLTLDSADNNLSLFTINYPASDLALNYQETISWNSTNKGKDILVSDNKEAYLDANDEIRGVDLMCAGSCDLNFGCSEQTIESHSIKWELGEKCVDGGILRAKNVYTNLETSGFKTDIGYSGHFYGIRKYDGLIPSAPYSVVISAQTGSNKSVELPYEYTEIEYGSDDYVNYSGIKLFDLDIQPGDKYGKSVNTIDDIMVVGAPLHQLDYEEYDENNNLTNLTLEKAGAVFVYRREPRPSGFDWPIDKHKSPWHLETKLTLPSGLLKDYYIPTFTNRIGNITLPLPITEKRWQVGQEGREFGHSVAVAKNSGVKSFGEDQREIIVVGGPGAKWTPRNFEELQTSGVQIGLILFTDEFTPTARSVSRGQLVDYNFIVNSIQNQDLIFQYFSNPPVRFDIKIIILEPLGDRNNRSNIEFPEPKPNFITKKRIRRETQGINRSENIEATLSGIIEAFHEVYPYDESKLNNNIPVILGFGVDSSRSMVGAVDKSLSRFIEYYKDYTFASGLRDFYGVRSSGEAYILPQDTPLHWTDMSDKLLSNLLDTGRLLVDNQVRFFTSGVGQQAFNTNLSQFNYLPDSGGKVFVFEKESGSWNLIQEIKSQNIIYDHPDRFGHSVSISKDAEVIAIGSPFISESCQVYEYKPQAKTFLYNGLFSWLSHKSSTSGGIGKYANLLDDFNEWSNKHGFNYATQILYSKLSSTDKFEARKYLNINEYEKIYSYSVGNLIGSTWTFIPKAFAPNPRLGYSTAVNEDGSIVAFGAPTDSFNKWDDINVYYNRPGAVSRYSHPTDQSIDTLSIIPSWASNVNAGAVRVFDSRKYYPHNKAIEFGKFGNLQKTTHIVENSGQFNYLRAIFQDKSFEETPFSRLDIPQEAGLAFIITPEVDAASDEVIDNIINWLALGDRNLVLVGNDPVWEDDGIYSTSNEIINKILQKLDSRMKLYPARNSYEAMSSGCSVGLPVNLENTTSSYIAPQIVNIYGVADIRTNFDNLPFLKDSFILPDCGSFRIQYPSYPAANGSCVLPITNGGDLRAGFNDYCRNDCSRLQPLIRYRKNLAYYFGTYTPPCYKQPDCDLESARLQFSDRLDLPNQEPVPFLAAGERKFDIITLPAQPEASGDFPIFETVSINSPVVIFNEQNMPSGVAFEWSSEQEDYTSLSIANFYKPEPVEERDALLQASANSVTEIITTKEEVSLGYFCVEQRYDNNSSIIAIAGTFTESESILYNAGAEKSFLNDENISFYANMVSKNIRGESTIVFLTGWTGRESFIDAYSESVLLDVFIDTGNDVYFRNILYSTDDICWIGNPINIPEPEEILAIKQWLAIGNKKLIITHDGSFAQMRKVNLILQLLESEIESLYLLVDNYYPVVSASVLSLNVNHPVSTGFNAQTSIKFLQGLNNSLDRTEELSGIMDELELSNVRGLIRANTNTFYPFKLTSKIIPIAYSGNGILDTKLLTSGYWKINTGAAKVSFPVIPGSGYRIFINTISENQTENIPLEIMVSKVSPNLDLPFAKEISIYSSVGNILNIKENFGFVRSFSGQSVSFDVQAVNTNVVNFYIAALNERIDTQNTSFIPKTVRLSSISGVLLPVEQSFTTSETRRISGYERRKTADAIPERTIQLERFSVIKNLNDKYCSSDCPELGAGQLIDDGPIVVAQELEHITGFNSGFNRSRITLISDASIVQGACLTDNEGRIPSNTVSFIRSLYPETNFLNVNSGRHYVSQSKIISPETGSASKYLYLNSVSGLNDKFGNYSTLNISNSEISKLESYYDPRYVQRPKNPWNENDPELTEEKKLAIISGEINSFRSQQALYGATAKFSGIIDGKWYSDSSFEGGLPELFKDKGYDYLDFDKLPSGYPGDLFGYSIALYKDKLVIGSPFSAFSQENINDWDYYVNGGSESGLKLSYNGGAGAVYVFEKTFKGSGLHGSLTPWEFTQKLRPQSINVGRLITDDIGDNNYSNEFLENNLLITDQFGYSIDIDSDIIAVGAPGHDFDNIYLNGNNNPGSSGYGDFIRKSFSAEFYIPDRKVIDLGNSGVRSDYENSGIMVLNNGAIFTFENKIVDWINKTKKWTLIEKLVPNNGDHRQQSYSGIMGVDANGVIFNQSSSLDGGGVVFEYTSNIDGGLNDQSYDSGSIIGTENDQFGSSVSIYRSFRSDSDYTIAGSSPFNAQSGCSYSYDIMLRKQPPALPNPSSWINGGVFGERISGGSPRVDIDVVNNNENNVKYFNSGIVYSDNKGQIFLEASGQDFNEKSFISHRPFIVSVDGKYAFGQPANSGLNLYVDGRNFSNNSMNMFNMVADSANVYNSLGLCNFGIVDYVTNLPSGFNLYINPDAEFTDSILNINISGLGIHSETLNMRIRGQA